MRSKGFTLIELLAVIVILAIIALIATPIVLNIINETRENAYLRSTDFYLDGVEQIITKKMMYDTTFKVSECEIQQDGNLKCDGKDNIIEVEVRGEKPSSGKICLSSKGIVDKVMVKYGDYYVSHDGKDTKLTDKDTFDSFSCSGKGISKVSIFKENDKEFVFNNSMGGYAISGTIDTTSLIIPELYDLIIDGNTVTQLISFYQDENLMFVNETVDTMVNVSGNEAMVVLFNELSGSHNVEIVKSNDTFSSHSVVRITEDDTLFVLSTDIVPEATVTVSILDQNNNELYNGSHSIEKQGTINGFVEYDLSSVYSKLSENNDVTITVTQTYNGEQKSIYTATSKPKTKTGSLWTNNKSYYYWGNDIIPFMFT